MDKYEYLVLDLEIDGNSDVVSEQFEKDLNASGAQGWKVVGTGGAGAGNDFGFSRRGWLILMREA